MRAILVRAVMFVTVLGPAGALASEQRPVARAGERTGSITIDGALRESAWDEVEAIDGFWQLEPHEGQSPSFHTAFRVLYDDDALYVGVWAFDPEPAAIRGVLTRRDEPSSSDWISVGIDSYLDHRTAFVFALNPAAVQRDWMMHDDVHEDDRWNAIWDGAAARHAHGWSAEFRIPFSQLRYASGERQSWGFQVSRVVQRTGERTMWAPIPSETSQHVSLYGTLDGIPTARSSKRVELLPYVLGGATFSSPDPADPFTDPIEPELGLGLDARYRLTDNFVVTLTVNPDFGQVEADPSEFNLTERETFFAEKRPFFLEGSEILELGLGTIAQGGSPEQLFYSRRIGAPPQGAGDVAGGYVDGDPVTSILGAAKLSGKTADGWSVATLHAVTSQESATVEQGDGARTEVPIEPLANYTVLRLRKDYAAGRGAVGLIGTAVHRDLTPELEWLPAQAYTGGLQLSHRFAGSDAWTLHGRVAGSRVQGSEQAIDAKQRASQRYFQRPDAGHLSYDPSRTSLSGAAASLELARLGGQTWRGGVGTEARSPGFEVNDLGFQRDADFVNPFGWIQYRDAKPGDWIRRLDITLNAWGYLVTAPAIEATGFDLSHSTTFSSYWGTSAGAGLSAARLDPRLLRGGPAVRGEHTWAAWASAWTDPRQPVTASLGSSAYLGADSGNRELVLYGRLTVQPMSNLELSAGPELTARHNDTQYVAEVADPGATPHYVLAEIDQTVAALTLRVAYTWSRRLSLQLYAQPFLTAGDYSGFKEVVAPRAERYPDRFHVFGDDELRRVDGELQVDADRDGRPELTFTDPDIGFRELTWNAVARWEYRPGATLFAIWSHRRTSVDGDSDFRLGRGLGELWSTVGEHVALLKLTYWMDLP